MSSPGPAVAPAASEEPKTEVRNTKQRQAVRAALQTQADFVTAQELHSRLKDDGQKVSLATTYRVLQSMTDHGEVDALRNNDGETMYRRCEAENHHHHLVCRDCGATVELEAPMVEAWAENTANTYGYTDLEHTIEIVGLCPRCRTEK